ncbi:unnamed protein product [Arctogadus glacialis]
MEVTVALAGRTAASGAIKPIPEDEGHASPQRQDDVLFILLHHDKQTRWCGRRSEGMALQGFQCLADTTEGEEQAVNPTGSCCLLSACSSGIASLHSSCHTTQDGPN